MISLTKGEGFGRPLLEFSLVNKPIIASGWSGHVDFLDGEFTSLLGGTLTNVHKSAAMKNMLLPEAQWFTPDDGQVAGALKGVFDNYKKYAELAKRQGHRSRTMFNFDSMADLLDSILTKSLPEFPKQVKLELPKLQLPKLQKL